MIEPGGATQQISCGPHSAAARSFAAYRAAYAAYAAFAAFAAFAASPTSPKTRIHPRDPVVKVKVTHDNRPSDISNDNPFVSVLRTKIRVSNI